MKPKDPQKIKRIFDASLSIVSEIGLAGLTMSDIGKNAGIGMGTIYTYFQSKEEIINALYVHIIDKHKETIYADLNDDEPFMVNFKRLFTSYLYNLWENDIERHFLDQCRTSPFLTDEVKVLENQVYTKANALLDRGKSELIIKFLDNKILLSFMIGGIKELVRQLKEYDLPLEEIAVSNMFDLCISSIKK